MDMPIHPGSSDRSPLVSGVFAAMTLPRNLHSVVDLDAFTRHLGFLCHAGINGFVLNGATGEYCLTSPEELGEMVRHARKLAGRHTKLVAAIGGASSAQILQRLEAAESAGADALLLPMPHFFPYEQQDLVALVREVASRASLPVLLYNLPTFTTALEPETTLDILCSTPGTVGIKDSSGSLKTVRLLAQKLPQANRVIGNDAALYWALAEDLCDGVVSGVASVLPELMQMFYSTAQAAPLEPATLELKAKLDAFIEWLGRFPVPWGLKMIAAERGLSPFDLPLPLSAARSAEQAEFLRWFRENRTQLLADAAPAVAV